MKPSSKAAVKAAAAVKTAGKVKSTSPARAVKPAAKQPEAEVVIKPADSKYGTMFALQKPGSDYPIIQFGVRKARLILEHINELQQFVEENVEH